MTITRPVQVFSAIFTLAVSFSQLAFLLVGDLQEKFHPIIPFLYIAFFWFFWAYARLRVSISPLLEVSVARVRGLLLLLSVSVVFIYFHLRAESDDVLMFDRFMSMHAFLIIGYLFVSFVLFFGDLFLGFFASFLKFGRSFERGR